MSSDSAIIKYTFTNNPTTITKSNNSSLSNGDLEVTLNFDSRWNGDSGEMLTVAPLELNMPLDITRATRNNTPIRLNNIEKFIGKLPHTSVTYREAIKRTLVEVILEPGRPLRCHP